MAEIDHILALHARIPYRSLLANFGNNRAGQVLDLDEIEVEAEALCSQIYSETVGTVNMRWGFWLRSKMS